MTSEAGPQTDMTVSVAPSTTPHNIHYFLRPAGPVLSSHVRERLCGNRAASPYEVGTAGGTDKAFAAYCERSFWWAMNRFGVKPVFFLKTR